MPEQPTVPLSRSQTRAPSLQVQNLCVDLGHKPVLHAVNFFCQRGEISAILGPNGAGKSTLMRACASLLPYQGSICFEGTPLDNFDARARAQLLTFVPQHSLLRSALPVREVVAQGRYASRTGFLQPQSQRAQDQQKVEEAMTRTDTLRFAERSYMSLSFGEQRRVLLARGLATGAKLLLLDEPSASLDIGHALELYALMRRLASQGYTLVVVLHQLGDALQVADNALLLHRGHVVAHGPTHEVIRDEVIRDIYGVKMLANAAPGFKLLDPEASS